VAVAGALRVVGGRCRLLRVDGIGKRQGRNFGRRVEIVVRRCLSDGLPSPTRVRPQQPRQNALERTPHHDPSPLPLCRAARGHSPLSVRSSHALSRPGAAEVRVRDACCGSERGGLEPCPASPRQEMPRQASLLLAFPPPCAETLFIFEPAVKGPWGPLSAARSQGHTSSRGLRAFRAPSVAKSSYLQAECRVCALSFLGHGQSRACPFARLRDRHPIAGDGGAARDRRGDGPRRRSELRVPRAARRVATWCLLVALGGLSLPGNSVVEPDLRAPCALFLGTMTSAFAPPSQRAETPKRGDAPGPLAGRRARRVAHRRS
jgi:hypothetical protein